MKPMNNKMKLAFVVAVITLPIWAIPTCAYALYCVAKGQATLSLSK